MLPCVYNNVLRKSELYDFDLRTCIFGIDKERQYIFLTELILFQVSILICLSVMVLVGSGFETKCPEPSQWKFRKKICDTPENYSCLYNIQTGQYEESCSDKIDFVKAGKYESL